MGREIRRVPPGWEHPKKEDSDRYQPLHDENYESALETWFQNHRLWLAKQHPDQLREDLSTYKYFAQWHGNPPDINYYRQYKEEECTAFQMYETVSEGTPVTPVFASLQELEDYLVTEGEGVGTPYNKKYSRAAAQKFCSTGWAPSGVSLPGKGFMDGISAGEYM